MNPVVEPFIGSGHCEAWIFCHECRTSQDFRASLAAQKAVPQADFPCPYGFTAENFPAKPANLPVLGMVDGTPVYDLPRIWGPRHWETLHRRALSTIGDDSQWLSRFGTRLPCPECRTLWMESIRRHPPDWERYFPWSVERHNEVNLRLGKPPISFENAHAHWSRRDRSDIPFASNDIS